MWSPIDLFSSCLGSWVHTFYFLGDLFACFLLHLLFFFDGLCDRLKQPTNAGNYFRILHHFDLLPRSSVVVFAVVRNWILWALLALRLLVFAQDWHQSFDVSESASACTAPSQQLTGLTDSCAMVHPAGDVLDVLIRSQDIVDHCLSYPIFRNFRLLFCFWPQSVHARDAPAIHPSLIVPYYHVSVVGVHLFDGEIGQLVYPHGVLLMLFGLHAQPQTLPLPSDVNPVCVAVQRHCEMSACLH